MTVAIPLLIICGPFLLFWGAFTLPDLVFAGPDEEEPKP